MTDTMPPVNPIADLAKTVADELWERATVIADIWQAGTPVDQKPLDDMTIWLVLEGTANQLSPDHWTDHPDAIAELHRLQQKFMPGIKNDHLKELARIYRQRNRKLPDPSITPVNPEFEKRYG